MHTTIKADPTQPRQKNYFWNLMEAVSQALAAIVGLNANLTFSAYCGYWKSEQRPIKGHFYRAVNFLFRDLNHCQNAWLQKT